jgi:hypothetical protein
VAEHDLPPVKPYHPTTFLERGVAVPFTTPLLGGTRARPAQKQCLELVIPNPSGGRGVYIMSWTSITSLCRPTLHDKVFNERIAVLDSVTPATIRRVARVIAAEGLAGEEAMTAARIATDADKGDRLVTNYKLLMTLVEQVADVIAATSPPKNTEALGPAARAQMTVDWISPRLGQPTTWTASALEDLADIMSTIGVGTTGSTGRVPRLVAMLRQVRTDIADWSKTQREKDQASYVHMVCLVADLTLTLAEATLAKAQALTANMVELLRTWAADPNSVIQLAARPEWLLDGWEQICLIWNHAEDDASRRAALIEIVGLVPVLPKEVSEWSSTSADLDESLRFRRLIPLNEDWRTGAVFFDKIARNEHFRAIAC